MDSWRAVLARPDGNRSCRPPRLPPRGPRAGREAMRETESSLQQFGEFLLKRQLEGRETNLSERRPLVRQWLATE